jgi:hypothetical protein
MQPTPAAPASGLPQPTAPFSTTRPANLGERVLHPVAPAAGQKPDIASLMAQELGQTEQPAPASSQPPMPTPPPTPPVSFQPQPVAPTPVPQPQATTPPPIGIPPTPLTPPAPTPSPVVPPTPQINEDDHSSGISFEETPRTPGAQPPQAPSAPFGAQPPRQ